MRLGLRSVQRALAVVGTVVLVLSPSAAHAASFNLYGAVPGSSCAGAGSGTVSFTSAYRFAWTGNVRDVCPGDLRGVELQVVIRHFDGTQTVKGNLVQDENGCGNGVVSGSGAVATTKKIKNVMVVLYSTRDGAPWVTLDLSGDLDNSFT